MLLFDKPRGNLSISQVEVQTVVFTNLPMAETLGKIYLVNQACQMELKAESESQYLQQSQGASGQ